MDDQFTFPEIAPVSLSQTQGNATNASQSSAEVPVSEATCLGNRFPEINPVNRAKAAQSLRAIAHLLMSGTLVFLLTFTTVISCQSSSLLEQNTSEGTL